jgi:hypothetical protein
MRFLLQILVVAVAMSSTAMTWAGDLPTDKSHCDKGCRVRCPNCCHECVFSAEKAKETKSCYDVECKEICIPRIVFPWQKCGCGKGGKGCGDGKSGCCSHHNGAKSKSVRVLVKYEYECSVCAYKWNPASKYSDKLKDGDLKADELEAPPLVTRASSDASSR